EHNLYNLYSKEHTDAVWGTEARRALRAEETIKNFNLAGIKPHDLIIVLKPGETILAHTNEFIGGRRRVTTMMKARSSLGRNFIEVCKCAGWGDVGYINRWTMEITNNSKNYTIPLVVGRRIAQIVFFDTGDIRDAAADYARDGKYQSATNIEEIKRAWKPEVMLPRMYLDREARI
ncbi:deoxycytidine triphosphate deaminase, partial [bacterium]|nr:deoxycytidine triphosphate deaminase [bacterium]